MICADLVAASEAKAGLPYLSVPGLVLSEDNDMAHRGTCNIGRTLRRVPIKINELGQTICLPKFVSGHVCNDSLSSHHITSALWRSPITPFRHLSYSCIEDDHLMRRLN